MKLRYYQHIFIWIILFTSCQSKHPSHHHSRIFQVTSPVVMDTAIIQEYVCQIHSFQHIELRALEKGYLQNIYVDEGQYVKKGQPMFQVMPNLYEAELSKAKAEVNYAEIEYENIKVLADSGIVSTNELALAKAHLDRAKAEMDLAEVHLGFTRITAPFSGIMDRFHVRLGSLLDEGEMLSSLSDNSQMWVYFNVPESEYLDYIARTKKDTVRRVNLRMANGKIFPYQGIVENIGADFNNETGNIPFRATFPNPQGLLRHGETGSILVHTHVKGALIIPQKASFEVLEKNYVYVINQENRVVSRAIKIKGELPHIYLIEEGLTTGDKILVEGLRLVKENERIDYEFHDPVLVLKDLELYAE